MSHSNFNPPFAKGVTRKTAPKRRKDRLEVFQRNAGGIASRNRRIKPTLPKLPPERDDAKG